MAWYSDLITFFNENTGATLVLSSIGFGINEAIKTRNARKIGNIKFKEQNIDIQTLEKEKELYMIFSEFCLSDDNSEENCLDTYEKIRGHIIYNDLFLREEISKLGSNFANYIIEEVSIGNKNYQMQEDLLKEFKKLYRL